MEGDELGILPTAHEDGQDIVFEAQGEDIILVSYPKCGTKWVQQLLQLIVNGGKSAPHYIEFMKRTPMIEITGELVFEREASPRLLRTHLPLSGIRCNNDAKFVYVARNPWDCCTSFFHHHRNWPWSGYKDFTFDEFFNCFINGEAVFGDFFDHLLPWYHRRNNSNVLFLTYEEMKENSRGTVLELARFLGTQYETQILQEDGLLETILEKSSPSFMKTAFECSPSKFKAILGEHPEVMKGVPDFFKDYFYETISASESKNTKGVVIVREGVVGDYKKHFTNHHLRRMNEWIEMKTSGSDVMKLWSGIEKPS